MMDVIKALFLDLDNTLHNFSSAAENAMVIVYGAIIDKYGLDRTKLKKRYAELLMRAEECAFLDGRLSTDYRAERFRNMLQTFGIEDEDFIQEITNIYGGELEKNMHPLPNIHSLLKSLRQRYELYIVTEGPIDAQHRAIEILGIGKYINRVFISGELKKAKSTGELFAHAIKESGYPVQQIMLVGDSYKRDVLGGLKVGLKVIWLNHKNEKIPEGYSKPHLEIKDINELKVI